MKHIFTIYLVLFSMVISAQDTTSCNCSKEVIETFVPVLQGQVYRGLAGMLGIEFFTPDYVRTDVYLESGEISHDQQIKYNGRIDGLLLLPPKSSREILLDKHLIKGFCLKDFAGSPYTNFGKIKIVNEFGNDSSFIFGQILYQSRLSLYAYRRYTNVSKIEDIVDGKRVTRQQIGPSFIYYFQLPNKKTIGFKRFKKRDLYKLFPENKELMRKIFKEKHQRRFRNEDDLIRITEILNPLYK